MKKAITALLFAFVASSTGSAMAQEHNMNMHMDMRGNKAAAAKATPSTRAYMQANSKMHKEMMMQYTGDPDIDFVRGMIPHHQGAIDMAMVELKYGKDPALRALAKRIIADQKREIRDMNNWLTKHNRMKR